MFRFCAVLLGCSVALAGTIPAAHAVTYKLLHLFPYDGGGNNSDGANPAASLINVDGTLYGTTEQGGIGGNYGAVFAINPTTGAEQVVYSFTQGQGFVPMAGLINSKGTLYGTTMSGGDVSKCSGGCGVVFSLNPSTGTERLVLPFEGKAHGSYPEANLIEVGGKLYGTTTEGGSFKNCKKGCGTVFSLNPKTGAEKIVYDFQDGGDGAYPSGALLNVGGTLYGTTQQGGGAGYGTVFSLDPVSGAEKILYSFKGTNYGPDGANPRAGLINIGTTLYGTTFDGGNSQYGSGTIFSLDLEGGVEKVVYSFQWGNDGSGPQAALIHVGNKLYGTTSIGGNDPNGNCGPGCGTVFSFDPATSQEQVLYAFQGYSANDGAYPLAGLINVGGALYGTTSAGGVGSCYYNHVFGCGTVFALTP